MGGGIREVQDGKEQPTTVSATAKRLNPLVIGGPQGS
jgi:hypothetical protein